MVCSREGLSILDVMMFNTPVQIQAMLDDYDNLDICSVTLRQAIN